MKKIKIESIEFYRLRYNKNIIVGYIRFNQLFNREEFIKFIYDKNISILRNKLLNYHILKNYEELNAARSPIGNWISPSDIELRGFIEYSLRLPDKPDESYRNFVTNVLEFLESLETLINE